MTIDPLGVEGWAQLGVSADASQSTVSVSATQDERHYQAYRPTVDGNSDDLVYIDLPTVLVTAHDCIAIHAFVRRMRSV
jgi:hypothetical protein